MSDQTCKKCDRQFTPEFGGPLCPRCHEERTARRKAIRRQLGIGFVIAVATTAAAVVAKQKIDDANWVDTPYDPFAQWNLPRYQVEKLFEAVEDHKIANSWLYAHKEALENGRLSVGEVIYFGGGTAFEDDWN